MGSVQQSRRHLHRGRHKGPAGRGALRTELFSARSGARQKPGIHRGFRRRRGRAPVGDVPTRRGASQSEMPLRALGHPRLAQSGPRGLERSLQSESDPLRPVARLRRRFAHRRVGLRGAGDVQHGLRRGDRGVLAGHRRRERRRTRRHRPFPRVDVRRRPALPEKARALHFNGIHHSRHRAGTLHGGGGTRHLRRDGPDQRGARSRQLQRHRQVFHGNGRCARSRLFHDGQRPHGSRGGGVSRPAPRPGDAERSEPERHSRLQRRPFRARRQQEKNSRRRRPSAAPYAAGKQPPVPHLRALRVPQQRHRSVSRRRRGAEPLAFRGRTAHRRPVRRHERTQRHRRTGALGRSRPETRRHALLAHGSSSFRQGPRPDPELLRPPWAGQPSRERRAGRPQPRPAGRAGRPLRHDLRRGAVGLRRGGLPLVVRAVGLYASGGRGQRCADRHQRSGGLRPLGARAGRERRHRCPRTQPRALRGDGQKNWPR